MGVSISYTTLHALMVTDQHGESPKAGAEQSKASSASDYPEEFNSAQHVSTASNSKKISLAEHFALKNMIFAGPQKAHPDFPVNTNFINCAVTQGCVHYSSHDGALAMQPESAFPEQLTMTEPVNHVPDFTPVVVTENTVHQLFAEGNILFHAMNTPSLEDLVDNRNPTYCTELLQALKDDNVQALSMTALSRGHSVATYRGTGIMINAAAIEPRLIARGDANSCTTSDNSITGQSDFNDIQTLQKYIRETPLNQRPAMNEVKGDFRRDAVAGLAFRVSVARTQEERKRENNQAFLQLSLLQKYVKENLGIDCHIYSYQSGTGELKLIGKVEDRKHYVMATLLSGFATEQRETLKTRVGW